MGFGLGFSITLSTLYIMEVTTPDKRGWLAVVPAIAGALGALAMNCMGAWLHWRWYSTFMAALHVPFFFMLLLIPETPVYLISKGQIERAHRVLRTVRGPRWDVAKELTDLKCAREVGAADERAGASCGGILAAFSELAAAAKPLSVSMGLMFFFQFTGIAAILGYTVDIFQ